MNSRRRFIIGAMLGMMVLSAALLFGATAAQAQLIWNPPCKNITFVNNTPCPATIDLITVPAGAVPVLVVPPFGSVGPIPVTPNPPGLRIDSIRTPAGFTHPLIIPGPPSPPAPVASNAWVPSVTLGPGGCCTDMYFDLTTCTVYLFPGAFPCRL